MLPQPCPVVLGPNPISVSYREGRHPHGRAIPPVEPRLFQVAKLAPFSANWRATKRFSSCSYGTKKYREPVENVEQAMQAGAVLRAAGLGINLSRGPAGRAANRNG